MTLAINKIGGFRGLARGAYDPTKAYSIGDVIAYGGALYQVSSAMDANTPNPSAFTNTLKTGADPLTSTADATGLTRTASGTSLATGGIFKTTTGNANGVVMSFRLAITGTIPGAYLVGIGGELTGVTSNIPWSSRGALVYAQVASNAIVVRSRAVTADGTSATATLVTISNLNFNSGYIDVTLQVNPQGWVTVGYSINGASTVTSAAIYVPNALPTANASFFLHSLNSGAVGTFSNLAVAGTDALAPDPAKVTTLTKTQRSPIILTLAAATNTFTALAAAGAELNGANKGRSICDLTGFVEARVSASVATLGSAGTRMAVQYSARGANTWSYLDGTSGAYAPVDTAVGLSTGAWTPLALAARGDVELRGWIYGGNGAASPVLGTVTIEVR